MAQADIKTTNRNVPSGQVRNIGIIAHIDAGKTTTSERILFYTGKSYKIGDIDDGDTQMDWMEQEKERGITIVSAATTTFWTVKDVNSPVSNEPFRINLIDTPGHVDFTAEVERSLRVLDGAVTVLDAEETVQSQTETVWRQADKYKVPRIIFVNKVDKLGANFEGTVKAVIERLGANPAVMAYPIGAENLFKGVVLLLERKALIWQGDETGAKFTEEEVPADMKEVVEKWRAKLVEQISETDDELLTKFLNGEEPTIKELKVALRKAVIAYKLVPVYSGASLRNKGVQPLLDAIVEYLPSPVDIDHVKGINPQTGEVEVRKTINEEAFCGLAFKVQTDPHVGRITYVRIYSGTLKAGQSIYNASKSKDEKMSRMLLMHANKREEIDQAFAGEIVTLVGLRETTTGNTLCDKAHLIALESITFPEPVISLAIEPKTKSDQEKMGYALNKLGDEDPTFRIKTNQETGQTIISGMGELHLEIIVDRMKREFGVEASTGAPQVAYKETIKKSVESEGKYIRQSGGRGQYGHCWIKLEPQVRGAGYEFVDAIKGGSIPNEFIPAIEKGVREAMENGVLAGFPTVDMKVTLFDGTYHDVDSSEMAFKIAGSMAFQSGTKQADPTLLEPIMKVEVSTPDDFMGDVIGDLSSKRAQILGTDKRGNLTIINAYVPLAELSGYATKLRSMSQGRATYYMEPSHYDEVPRNIQEQIVAKSGKTISS
ncbi:MAG: Elongation factor G [Candidatus Amesbacteria bacterium GW2011_GWA2_42_12]|uniref:Elongation factor G n=1 Tax=Candidatus Amesbacteria bacterium GW2011_GWA2_42_12 TaxID=1618356 RepID=A0A0G1B704_9BACT|nr:MAG: Elongation factor G [Candidatus Amesbacteria bacterium GW2011_GWA2_42_12]